MKDAIISPKDILRLLKQQGYRCAYTGDELLPENVSADHVVPLASGGLHSIENIKLVTMETNRAKGTMGFSEFVALCRKVVAHADNPIPTQAEHCEPLEGLFAGVS